MTVEVEKGKKIDFTAINIATSNFVYAWDGATSVEGTDNKKAQLIVQQDCVVTAYVGLRDFKLSYSVIGDTGGTIEIKGKGFRPKDPSKPTPKDEWTQQILNLATTIPVSVKGGDEICVLLTPAPKHAPDYFILTSAGESKKSYDGIWTIEEFNRVGVKTTIYGDTDVKLKFRDYYILKTSVSNADAGTLEIKQVMRGGVSIQLPLEEVHETDIEDKPIKDTEGKLKILGYKILDGDVITFEAKPNSGYKVKEWYGFGYDDEGNKDPTPDAILRDWTAKGDLPDVMVTFQKK